MGPKSQSWELPESEPRSHSLITWYVLRKWYLLLPLLLLHDL